MNATLSKFICTAAIAALLAPAPAMANSLRLKTADKAPASSLPKEDSAKPEKPGKPEAPAPESGKKGGENQPLAAPGEESIVALGERRDDLSPEALNMPSSKGMGFLSGSWGFDRIMIDSKGRKLKADFEFDEKGRGTASLSNGGTVYTAAARAFEENGALKIRTTPYTSGDSPLSYSGDAIECSKSGSEALCKSMSGIADWEGQRLMRHKPSDAQGQPEDTDSKTYFGPELPADITKNLPSATAGNGLAALEGAWRYSRNLLRKEDGQLLGLEFYFDSRGNGRSVLKDGSSSEFLSEASASALNDGTLLVKTGEYRNGEGQTHHSTFMECRPGTSGKLDCSVSNGWSRSEHGRLLPKEAVDEREKGSSDKIDVTGFTPIDKPGSPDTPPVIPYQPQPPVIPDPADDTESKPVPATQNISQGKADDAASLFSGMVGKLNSQNQEAIRKMNQTPSVKAAPKTAEPKAKPAKPAAKTAAPEVQPPVQEPEQKKAEENIFILPKAEMMGGQPSADQDEQAAAAEDMLVIPENHEGPPTFLEGHWLCDTGLMSLNTGQPVVVEFAFDQNGTGTGTIRGRDGKVFTSPAGAVVEDGTLLIHTKDYKNSESWNDIFHKSIIECRNDGGYALCSGRNGGTKWTNRRFVRIQ